MNKIVLAILLLFVVGCDAIPVPLPTNHNDIDEVCINGVTYIFLEARLGYAGYGYMSVKFNPDSTVVTCNE